MGTVRFSVGNVFDEKCDLALLPCSTEGSTSSLAEESAVKFRLPKPVPMRLGKIKTEEFPRRNDSDLAKFFAWCASVDHNSTNVAAIEKIGQRVGAFTREQPTVRLVHSPLFGTGAGRLEPHVAANALVRGFLGSAAADATLVILSPRAEVMEALYSDPELQRQALGEEFTKEPPEPHSVQETAEKPKGKPSSQKFIDRRRLGTVFGTRASSFPQQHFSGQHQHLLQAIKRQLLEEGDARKAIGISGPPGVGKTMLAHLLAYDEDVRRKFSDGVFYSTPMHALFQQTRSRLAIAVPEISAASDDEFLSNLSQRKILLIFDEPNLDTEESFFAINRLTSHCPVLILTQNKRALQQLQAEIHILERLPTGEGEGEEIESAIDAEPASGEDQGKGSGQIDLTTIFRKTYSAFVPDRAAYGNRVPNAPLDDALGVGVYAGHLAQVIAAKETYMPLSIGLFGAWGAGKSHFIDLLDEHLRSLTAEPGKVFYHHIVQIRFNAWHYLDTNLWANLVCEIFDQLFAKLDERKDTSQDQVNNLKKKLADQSALAAEAKAALQTAEKARKDAEEQLCAAMLARAKEEENVGKLLDDLSKLLITPEVKDQLKAVARGLGVPRLKSSYTELEMRANEVRSLGGRMKALLLTVFAGPGGWTRGLLLVVALAVPLAVSWFAAHGSASVQNLLSGAGKTITQIIGAIGALSAWLSTQVKRGNTLVTKLEEAYDKVKAVRSDREKEDDAAKAQKKLAAKRQAEDEARHALREAEAKMKALRTELAELAPGRQLIRFLKERASAEDYRRHLGLVSLVRRDFEQLSTLLTKAGEDKDPTLPQIDRIVLYIDDLDRCRADRVVEVLEAVHLLLAFPLFAVVVAVDPRWIRQSLLDHYPRLLGRTGDTSNPQSGTAATPQDYLEKIFQIPFNLEAMGKEGFQALVKNLFPPAKSVVTPSPPLIAPPPTVPPSPTAPVAPAVGMPASPASPAPGAENKAAPASSDSPPSSGDAPKRPVDPQRLTLSQHEMKDIQVFQPLFETPRALKRFANTYCLIRVGVDETDWNDYLGHEALPGEYRIPMLLLAVAAAFPALARSWLRWTADNGLLAWKIPPEQLESLASTYKGSTEKADWERLARCLGQLSLTDWPTEPNLLRKWLPRVARYSF